jgi:hypothetical protein
LGTGTTGGAHVQEAGTTLTRDTPHTVS